MVGYRFCFYIATFFVAVVLMFVVGFVVSIRDIMDMLRFKGCISPGDRNGVKPARLGLVQAQGFWKGYGRVASERFISPNLTSRYRSGFQGLRVEESTRAQGSTSTCFGFGASLDFLVFEDLGLVFRV